MMGSWEMGFKAYGIDVFSFLFFSLFLLLYEVCTKYPKARASTPSDILKTFAVPIPLFLPMVELDSTHLPFSIDL